MFQGCAYIYKQKITLVLFQYQGIIQLTPGNWTDPQHRSPVGARGYMFNLLAYKIVDHVGVCLGSCKIQAEKYSYHMMIFLPFQLSTSLIQKPCFSFNE